MVSIKVAKYSVDDSPKVFSLPLRWSFWF